MTANKGILFEQTASFNGSYPDVPIADGVSLSELTAGDANPMFITLPLMKVNTQSRNGRIYDREQVTRIMRQINSHRPVGEKGHLRDEDRPYSFEVSPLRWVGAMLEADGTLWGKAYVLPSAVDVREYIRTAKASNARIGTSIYGTAVQDEKGNISDIQIESIDLVHPDRTGVPLASAVPMVTQEMVMPQGTLVTWGDEEYGILDVTEGDMATVRQLRREGDELLETGEMVSLSLGALKRASSDLSKKMKKEQPMQATPEAKPVKPTVSETENTLREQLRAAQKTVAENATKLKDLATIVSELGNPADVVSAVMLMKATLEQYKAENTELLQEAITAGVAEAVKFEARRPIIVRLVAQHNPTTRAQVKQAIAKVLEAADVKSLLAETLAQSMPTQPSPAPIGETNKPGAMDSIFIPA